MYKQIIQFKILLPISFAIITFFTYIWPSPRSNTIVYITTTTPSIIKIFPSRVNPLPSINKQSVYDTCKSFTQGSRLLGSLQRNNSNGALFFPNSSVALQDIHLLLRYSPRKDDEGGIYLQLANLFLLSQNLQRLSKEQQIRTRVAVFLSERYPQSTYDQLASWFTSIYAPYSAVTRVIRTPGGNQASWEFMMKHYVHRNDEIQLDTILYQLEDDYICETETLQDTIEFFASHNPCFVHQTDYPDRYSMSINDDDGKITVVAGRTRIWRSIPSTTVSYACRFKTFLAFEDHIMHPNSDWGASHKVRALGGNAIFFNAIPSHCAHTETLLWLDQHSSKVSIDTAPYHKDWWSFARRALTVAQRRTLFPAKPLANTESFVK